MQTTEEFLYNLGNLEVKLWIEGDRLRCNAPKGTLTPSLRAELSKRKAEIMAFLERTNLSAHSSLETILSVPRDGELPLSSAQERLWFIDQLEGASATYNIPLAFHLSGPLHADALEMAVQEIVRRHESLRTTFSIRDGSPVQIIAPTLTLTLSIVELQELSEDKQLVEVRRLALEEPEQPFDLVKGPLMRITLLRLREEEHILLLTMHHIVADGWSLEIFARELSVFYEAFSQGKPAPLPELSIQYADFAHWQSQWLQGEVLETQLKYWKQQLAGVPTLLEIPTDRPRPPIQSCRGSSESFQISQDLTEKLKVLSQTSEATLFMTLLAVFTTLLYRYSSQEDIVIGYPIANRNRREIEPLIGFFVNTLVLRIKLQGNPSFADLLSRVRRVALDAYSYQDLPFEKLVEELQPERNPSYNPLVQVMFAWQNTRIENLELTDLTVTPLEIERSKAKFDLNLEMMETKSGLQGILEYNCDLFDSATICRMVRHFQNLLEGIVANPEQQISELPLLTEAERQQLLVEWNQTQAEYPKDKCIHQLFEQQVKHTPNSIAVEFENQYLTYSELNIRANQLAHQLQKLGVRPEVLVGICVERSLEMLIGILGILKAGGAYVPLDPTYPQERLAFMLKDAQISVLLTQQHLVENFLECKAHQICLDKDLKAIASQDNQKPVSGVKSENLAYIIYTSGSTGKPKGTMIPHQGLVNYLSWCTKRYAVAEGYGAPVQSSIGFDATITSLFSPLLVGQRVVLLPEKQEIEALSNVLLSENNFSLVKITPAHLEILNQLLPDRQGVTQTRALILGGEALLAKSLSFWRTNAPKTRLINEYGPTETVVGCCVYEVSEHTSQSGSILIGRPIANTQLYVLDKHQKLLPIGIPGELYIGGAGVARGYLNRPDLTAEKFISNPFSNEPGARLYKTGDLARYLPDGNLEYLGRIDHQVKIRGFRIELGEIESLLAQHPDIQSVAVIAREDQPGDKRLVSYIIPEQDKIPTNRELQQFMKEKLPDYMIPSAFVIMESLPLTTNGKIDRRALPATDNSRSIERVDFVAPRNLLEEQLVKIWENVLNVDLVGVRDNFFDLGGHSLLAVRLMAEIQQQFGKNLPLATVLQNPTIEQMVRVLEPETNSVPWSPLVAIQPNGSKRPLFCVPGGAMDVIYFRDLARHLGSDQPFYGLQPKGIDGELEPHTRIEEIAACYIEAIQSVQPRGPYFLGGHSFGSYIVFEMAQQLQRQEHEVALLVLMDEIAPATNIQKSVEVDINDTKALTRLVNWMERFFDKKVKLSYEVLSNLDEEEQLSYLAQQLKIANLLPSGVATKQLRGFLKLCKSTGQAFNHYVPQSLHSTQITLFRAKNTYLEDFADFSSVREFSEILKDPTLGWNDFSDGLVKVHVVPGDHITMMAEPHVQILAERLKICIEKANADKCGVLK